MEGPQPIEVTSRVIAHIAHRVPFAKKVAKRFEGRDKSSGIFSDILTLVAQIAARNEDLIKEQGASVLTDIFSNGNKASKPSSGSKGRHVELGPQIPIKPNNGGN